MIEHKLGRCDECGKVKEMLVVQTTSNGEIFEYQFVCRACLKESERAIAALYFGGVR